MPDFNLIQHLASRFTKAGERAVKEAARMLHDYAQEHRRDERYFEALALFHILQGRTLATHEIGKECA